MRRLNFLGLIIALLLLGICLLFLLPAALSGNLLFAFGHIGDKPAQVILYHTGQTLVFYPDDPEYDLLVDACYETLRHPLGVGEIGWSDGRFEQARKEGIAVELLYAEPVKLPGERIDIADPTRLFFPVDVRGAAGSGEVVFRGGGTFYWGGPIRVDTLEPVAEAINTIISGSDS